MRKLKKLWEELDVGAVKLARQMLGGAMDTKLRSDLDSCPGISCFI
ncbi:hypothetical protein PENVUL_c001G08725 [Penicillium vulpinum]|uniref:Uncharacterized protein n=1 Tax=Penicillium vulpinum TaxID=29845 RepID=A0A1V6SE58_9EURO|nr:hypothetical protein PENVUL_c001G08725 [Penicillium vulpinum]